MCYSCLPCAVALLTTCKAISVSLPTWKANVGYEEGQEWVISKLTTGYPRFFIHKSIASFAKLIVRGHGSPGDHALVFPSRSSASRCVDFILSQAEHVQSETVRIVDLVPNHLNADDTNLIHLSISSVLFPENQYKLAKAFWQHTGEGVSSRQADYCRKLYEEGLLAESEKLKSRRLRHKGPHRYRKEGLDKLSSAGAWPSTGDDTSTPAKNKAEPNDWARFVEERFGRNINKDLAASAKLIIKTRICDILSGHCIESNCSDLIFTSNDMHSKAACSSDDVYLYPCGMNSIYNTHRGLMEARGPMKSICFGFPYVDTLKVLEKFGPGTLFYGHGSAEDLDQLQTRLEAGEKYLALFCEFPSNPLLNCPDLQRIRSLAEKYDFGVVIDETVGNFLNVNVLPYADVIVSSLTKIFSGDSNVMGGSAVLNPNGRYYELLKQTWNMIYEDQYWPEDAIFMERNSRDFLSRSERVNRNAEAVCDVLVAHPRIKRVYYPKVNTSRPSYDYHRTSTGGYGGLLSATFYSHRDAAAFYDNLHIDKGPSLGTNFTLASPFAILAHFTELEWAAQYGVEASLVRFSVGLEDADQLVIKFRRALAAIPS